MDFDSIFPLIFIIIAILSVIGKAKTKSKPDKGAKPKGGGGWIDRLNAFLDDLQKRVEAQSKEDEAPTADQWRELMDETTTIKSRPDRVEDEELELDFVETPAPRRKKHPAPTIHKKEIAPVETPLATDAAKQAMRRRRKSLDGLLPLGKNELRKAIVMAEIIGPPLALKTRSHGREV